MIDIRSAAFWRATLALCLGSFTIFSNVYVTQPLLPTLAEHFHVSPLMAGWSFTVTTLMLGLSLLVYGPLSDAVGPLFLRLPQRHLPIRSDACVVAASAAIGRALRAVVGRGAGLQNYRRIRSFRRLHNRLNLLHVVNIERRNSVAVFRRMIK